MSQQIINIFFSWQNDLPRKVNTGLIRSALYQAKSELEESYPSIHINIDEATNGEAGSPDIVETILKKIDQCDFYIADVSIINNDTDNEKKMPNPNVLFECGYALNTLGWERITLLFNDHFGELESLPFDLPRRRISKYTAPLPESSKKDLKSNPIYSLIKDILLGWIERIDKLPPVIRKTNPTAIKNQRDIESLKTFFSCFDVYSIQKLCENLPDCIDDGVHFHYVMHFEYLIQNVSFHIYHEELNELIKDFSDLYIYLIDVCGFLYENIGSYPYRYKFINQSGLDAPLGQEQQERYDAIKKLARELFEKLNKILDIVRKGDAFIDVDINGLGEQAYQNYYQEMLKRKEEIDGGRSLHET